MSKLAPRSAAPALLALALLATACATTGRPSGDRSTAAPSRTALLLAINDVYRIEGAEEGRAGGIARLRTLRRELERDHPDLLMLHAGDVLFPSFASRMYNGEQMIAALDRLDGDGGFDGRMFVTFGNHEFDKRRMKDAGILAARVAESEFLWLGGNVTFAPGDDGRPLVAAPNVVRTALVSSGGIRIGLLGVTIPTPGIEYAEFAGPIATARELTAKLRAQGAEIVVAVTHLNAADDRKLLETLGDAGPDLIVGGHDHERMAFLVGHWLVVKADADARTAAVFRLTLSAQGKLDVHFEHRPLSAAAGPEPDPDVQAVVDRWQTRHAREFCAAKGAGPDCLAEVYGKTRTLLEAEENKIRGRETSLGDWVADQMLAAFAPCGAQVAFLNAGTLRLNQDLAAGSTLSRRQVEELFGFPAPLRLIKIDPELLAQTAEHALRGWPGSGSWLQIGGFAFVHDQQAKSARRLTLLAPEGARTPRPGEPILAVVNDYLVNPDPKIGDRDGYDFLPTEEVPGCPASGRDLKDIVTDALKKAGPDGIAPVVEGRICQGEGPCRAIGG